MATKKVITPSIKKKQSQLFSFFTKRNVEKPTSSRSPSLKKSNEPFPATSSASSESQKSSVQLQPSSLLNSNKSPESKPLGKIRVGLRVSVHWPDDNEYYPATITAKKRHAFASSSSIITLAYDDGDVETLDLSKEKFKILDDSNCTSASSNTSVVESKGTLPLSQTNKSSPSNKKRRIIEEEDEEYEFDNDDDNDDDDDASEFSAPVDETDEEEEGGDVSMISDEDNEVISRKSRKTATALPSETKKRLRVTPVENPYESNRKKPATSSMSQTSRATVDKSNSPSFITPPSNKKTSSFSDTSNTSSPNSFNCFSLDNNLDGRKTATKLLPLEEETDAANLERPKITQASIQVPAPKATQINKSIVLPQAGVTNPAGTHYHNHFTFLQPSNRRDKQNRLMHDKGYDPRTLHVDYTEIEKVTNSKITDASKQWWELKARYADTILLFKTGKFYEIFHMDADIAVQVLGFIYMKGCAAHAGFPEVRYGYFCNKLVQAGYKVARVEQTETPEMLKERKKKMKSGKKKPKVVNREVCSIVSAGTRTFCYLDDINVLEKGADGGSIGPLLAIKEVLVSSNDVVDDANNSAKPVCEYGIVAVDACRGVVTLGQFADDVLRTRMNTLLTTFRPVELLVESESSDGDGGASPTLLSLLKSIIKTVLPSCRLEKINSEETFPKSTAVDADVRSKIQRPKSGIQPWDVVETVMELHRKGYYPRSSRKNTPTLAVDGCLSNGTSRWPEVLQACINGGANLALSAFGASLFYLQRSLIDEEILSMGEVKAYCPSEPLSDMNRIRNNVNGPSSAAADSELRKIATMEQRVETGIQSNENPGFISKVECLSFDQNSATEALIDHMSLDGTTIANLEILTNMHSNTVAGSLWSKINFAKSPHGCRLLRAWLLRPLFRKADIDRRSDAIEELTLGEGAVAMSEARALLGKCGDMERLLSRVHSMGGNGLALDGEADHHPNERAVLYETHTHTRRKVGDFSKLLNGLRAASQIPEVFSGVNIQSGLLLRIVRTKDNGGFFPSDIISELDWFYKNFDCNLAAKGMFEPVAGVNENYDNACAMIERIKQELDQYKDEVCSTLLKPTHLVKNQWKYGNIKDDSKDKYLIELPVNVKVPGDFILKGKRGKGPKQINKYRSPVVQRLVEKLEHAIDVMRDGKAHGMQMVFAKFDSMRSLWASAVQATSILDALGALAEASSHADYCRPVITDCPVDGTPSIVVKQGRHPSVGFTHSGDDFIPNDLSLGGNNGARMLLLSGPNMGGKSTLLRQTCLIAILAQIGCFVPAQSCTLTPFDRIFTRLGASDRILLGQSTFFVELAETAAALRGATRRSLVIMDELGRGTSTFDGTAIASATVKHLVERNKCLTLFATHYHSLLEEFKDTYYVRLGHMECLVDEGDENHAEPINDDKNITFLYTLGEGSCPKSFGINVARLAGLPREVLSKAREVSLSFEDTMNKTVNHESEIRTSLIANSLKEKLNIAVKDKNWGEVERLWDELQ